jgi:hypothetical protein
MADELPNAVALMRSVDFRDWLLAAGAYQARVVLAEPDTTPLHDVRLKLAEEVLMSPAVIVDRLVNAIATDPEVAGKGQTPQAVTQALILKKVDLVWSALARMSYPNG